MHEMAISNDLRERPSYAVPLCCMHCGRCVAGRDKRLNGCNRCLCDTCPRYPGYQYDRNVPTRKHEADIQGIWGIIMVLYVFLKAEVSQQWAKEWWKPSNFTKLKLLRQAFPNLEVSQ